MPKDALKAEWVKRLRSGEYKQARGVLHSSLTDGHCCIGVLAEIADPEALRAVPDTYQDELHNHDLYAELRLDVIKMKLSPSLLIRMNDDGYSFDQIADVIEGKTNADKLFYASTTD